MKKLFCFIVAFCAMIFLPTTVLADSLYLTTLPSQIAGGYYVGPTGATYDGQSLEVMCDTFYLESYVPSSFAVNVETVNDVAGAYFATTPNSYKELAILDYEAAQTPGEIPGIQFAIWDLFDSSAPSYGNSGTWLSWVQGQNLGAWTYSGDIFTPSDSPNQEFTDLMAAPLAPAPESGTFLLVLIGFGFLFLLRRRHYARRECFKANAFQ